MLGAERFCFVHVVISITVVKIKINRNIAAGESLTYLSSNGIESGLLQITGPRHLSYLSIW